MRLKVQAVALSLALLFVATTCGSVPVIYCTDLFHPHEDPDDHFDLASLFSLPDIDIRAIILDQGERQKQSPGSIPVSQLMQITGRRVPTAIGLARPLRGPDDTALDQPDEFQEGVQLILGTLRESPDPVNIVTVGSVRDVVAAWNREPELCRRKIKRLLIFIGEASKSSFLEYNVGLDRHAFVRLMRSDLPIWWVPCFDGGVWQNHGHASYWKASHRDLLQQASPEVIQYFIYALQKPDADPLEFLNQRVNPQQREILLAGERNLWCTTIFEVLTWPAGKTQNSAFRFRAVDIQVDNAGAIDDRAGQPSHTVMQFEVLNQDTYAASMTRATATLLSRLGVD